jgi:2,3-diaminopropionate biosynthesis protein SbnB
MAFEFYLISGGVVNEYLTSNTHACYEAISEAYLLYDDGQAINPNSYFLRFPDKPKMRIIALPAHLGGRFDSSGIKWIASNPDNIQQSLPRASAVLILNDYETGYPYACIEASLISAERTALSAVLAAEQLSGQSKKINKLGIIGCGILAKSVYNVFIKLGWKVGEVVLFDLDDVSMAKLSKSITQKVSFAKSSDDLVAQSDVIVLTTSALSPYINDVKLFSHAPIVLNISLRDLAPEILINANNYVDDVEHVLQANTSPHLTYQAYSHKDFINGTIADLINNKIEVDELKTRIFSPMGMGILDLALGKLVFEHAYTTNQAIIAHDFFYKLER